MSVVDATQARQIAFCADDVGLVVGVADTVARLAVERRLSSASCVTSAVAWSAEGAALSAATSALDGFELGLHFNLTEGAPLSPDLARSWPTLPSLKELIVGAHLGSLPLAALAIEWRAQSDAFADVVGRAPEHVDGHQHVHHLPRIRQVMLDALMAVDAASRPAVRNTGRVLGPGYAFKRTVIEGTGGRALQRELRRKHLRHNDALLGVYDFHGADYRALVRAWLAEAPAHGSLVFCHPRFGAESDGDPIAAARRREADYLASAAFGDDLAEARVSVATSWRSSSAD